MAERKSTAVLIKLSPAEKRALSAAARRENLPMATWLRALGLHAARAANEKGHTTMKMILVASMLAFAVACGGSTGDAGAAGPAGPTGPQGPQGPAATDQVRLRVFITSGSTTAFAACPAESHAIGGSCSCFGTAADARTMGGSLLLLGAGGYSCGCAGTVTGNEVLSATAQVTCIDGANVVVQ